MIYLDYNATTPVDKKVAEAMLPFIYGEYGNPSSSHELGFSAKMAIEQSRSRVADLLSCSPEEVLFTSGGSESNNTVIKGVALTSKEKGNHIVTSQIEHPSVLNPCRYLEKLGCKISYLPVDEYGAVNAEDLEKLITEKTILVTVMHSNNETGTLQPIKEISEVCRKHNILLHTDASQSVGKIPINVKELGVDFLTVAGHKLYAPKGIGALYIKQGINIEPLIHGAGHENGRRAGTENTIFDVALGKACEIAKDSVNDDRVEQLTRFFYAGLKETFGDKVKLNGHPEKRLPNTLNISFLGYTGMEIILRLGAVAVSTGSACHSGLTTISPVLAAMSVSDEAARGAIRFSLGRYTTKEEINVVLDRLNKMRLF